MGKLVGCTQQLSPNTVNGLRVAARREQLLRSSVVPQTLENYAVLERNSILGVTDDEDELSAEFFSMPYLFNGARPAFEQAPYRSLMGRNSSFGRQTCDYQAQCRSERAQSRISSIGMRDLCL